MRTLLGILLVCQLAFSASFSESKTLLKEFYYSQGGGKDFYCGAEFRAYKQKDKIKIELLDSEKFAVKNNKVEWEHIMPASVFGAKSVCWKKGGRKECGKNALFKQMESDVQNIVPAIAQINRDRRDYEYAQTPENVQYFQYGECKIFIDSKRRKIYVNDALKGYIARSYLYMVEKYGVQISESQMEMMTLWSEQFPESSEEKRLRQNMNVINKMMGFKDFTRDLKKTQNILKDLLF